MKRSLSFSILLTGLMAAAGAQAQTAHPQTSATPLRAGEASTFVQGRPNLNPNIPAFNPNVASTKTRAEVIAELMNSRATYSGAPATWAAPPRAGEASTFVQGRPNLNPNLPAFNPAVASGKSRAEVIAELMNRRQIFEAVRSGDAELDTTRFGMLQR